MESAQGRTVSYELHSPAGVIDTDASIMANIELFPLRVTWGHSLGNAVSEFLDERSIVCKLSQRSAGACLLARKGQRNNNRMLLWTPPQQGGSIRLSKREQFPIKLSVWLTGVGRGKK